MAPGRKDIPSKAAAIPAKASSPAKDVLGTKPPRGTPPSGRKSRSQIHFSDSEKKPSMVGISVPLWWKVASN